MKKQYDKVEELNKSNLGIFEFLQTHKLVLRQLKKYTNPSINL